GAVVLDIGRVAAHHRLVSSGNGLHEQQATPEHEGQQVHEPHGGRGGVYPQTGSAALVFDECEVSGDREPAHTSASRRRTWRPNPSPAWRNRPDKNSVASAT